MDADTIDALVRGLAAARNAAEIEAAMDRFVHMIGFETFAYVAINLPEAQLQRHIRSSTYPQSWVEHYRTNDFASIDPTFPRSNNELLPFRWEGIIADGRVSDRQKQIFRDAKEFGLRQGVTIPIHGAGAERGLLSVTSDARREEFEKRFLEFRSQLMFGAYCYHNTMRDFVGTPKRPVKLGAREMEVLVWAARGKTAWETGEILRISERTVNFHLRGAIEKLSAANKRQAVVRAIMLGAIFP